MTQVSKPVKSYAKPPLSEADHMPKVVSKHRLAEGHYSTVFPQDAGLSGPRNGHMGGHTVASTKRK